jgi:DNA mismatch repair protein MSH3
VKSTLLADIIKALPPLQEPVRAIIAEVSLSKATQGDKVEMWTDPERYPDIAEADMVCGAPASYVTCRLTAL